MKKILVSMFAVAALAACTTEQTIVVPQNEAIGFDTFVDNSTRATDITKDNLTEFGVYASIENASGAALILTNERVYNDGGWKYNNTQYWVPQANYEFTAFAPRTNADITPAVTAHWTYTPTTADGKTTADNGVVTFNNEGAAADQDFIFAAADRDMTNVAALESQPEKVSFTFAHELSKIAFKFNNGFIAANNITLRVYNVKAAGLVSEATENIASGVASEWTKKGDATFARTFGAQAQADATVIEALNNYTTDHHYFIPVAGTQYTITFDVDLIQAGVTVDTYHHTINTIPTLAKGSNYMFTTTLDASNVSDDPSQQLYPIEFTVNDVEDWRDNGSVALTEPVEVATADALKAAIKAGENVKLMADIALTESVLVKDVTSVIDLNGFNLVAESTDAIVVEGANLTINGNGDVKAATDDKSSANALWVKYGNVVINGGNYYVGADNALRNDCIYLGAASLKTEAANHVSTITINGGTFEAKVEDGQYWVLNVQDDFYRAGSDIVVYGGSYKNFNPADNKSEGAGTNFLAPGKTVEEDEDWYIVK